MKTLETHATKKGYDNFLNDVLAHSYICIYIGITVLGIMIRERVAGEISRAWGAPKLQVPLGFPEPEEGDAISPTT